MVYKDRADEMLPKLSQAFTASLGSGVQEGYKENLFGVKWDSPDNQMIRHLQQNTYEFSSAKSYQQLRAMTDALYDPATKKLVPEREFLELASRINNEMGVTHLVTERNTAIAGGQMASRWVQYQDEKEELPLLTYQTAGDGLVRPTHAAIDNVTRPVDDAFWKEYYPPNGWNCRCHAIQATGGRKATPVQDIRYPDDVPDMFKTNLAEGGLAFPDHHPYYENLPAGLMDAAKKRNPFSYTKLDGGKDGGYIYNNAISSANTEELETARILADNGQKVIMLPHVDIDTDWQQKLRSICLPKETPAGKNVDSMIDGQLVEFKYTAKPTANAIDRHLRDGSKQAGIVCIRLGGKMKAAELNEAIRKRIMRVDLQEVWIIKSGKLTKYLRKDFLK